MVPVRLPKPHSQIWLQEKRAENSVKAFREAEEHPMQPSVTVITRLGETAGNGMGFYFGEINGYLLQQQRILIIG